MSKGGPRWRLCRPFQIDRVPQKDGDRHQVEAVGAIALLLEVVVTDFAETV